MPVGGRRAYYTCGVRGHIRRDCPYGVGGRVPRPEQGKWQVLQVGCWVREPRRLKICWACGREGHLRWACPGPRQRVQVSPGEGAGPWRDPERPTTAKKRQVCWGCQKPGHIRRHCPLKGVEGRPVEVLDSPRLRPGNRPRGTGGCRGQPRARPRQQV
uniref:CCHC-type domain-containing protein n=1 Tax=Chrysemys picta bellii TaxID=8478 RepID=A0A8C3IQQ7_CHRPI